MDLASDTFIYWYFMGLFMSGMTCLLAVIYEPWEDFN